MSKIDIRFDGTFDIAIGNSRKETRWKGKDWAWSKFLQRIENTTRTAETLAVYMKEQKSRQDEIKDIGGFVGGLLANGRRKAGNVVHRQLITLDIDHSKENIWDDFQLLYGCAGAIYSTHKHTPGSPRLRLIIPLDRPVFRDEYVAISRKIAGNLGIENFDHTTFEPSRLMYWPSTSIDAEYFFEYQDGEWLSADEILNSYKDWKDSSQWPISERYNIAIQRAIVKQGDPLEKDGLVGAFCRVYPPDLAIETFLSDVYTPCDVEGRYTYKEGSTTGGLVMYEDRFVFSHHGTDPVSGKLCNSFDLVRLQLFGLMDEDARENTPTNKLPSFSAMVSFAAKEPHVRQQLGAEKYASAVEDFKGIDLAEYDGVEEITPATVEAEDLTWLGQLETDKKGNYYSTINNIVIVLNNDPYLKGRFAKNLFEQREVAVKDLPWRKISRATQFLTDSDDAHIRHYLEKAFNLSSTPKVRDAMDVIVNQNAFHPVKDYLSGLTWDGTERLDTLFIDTLGAEDCEYTRAVTRKFMTAAVARIYRPGCKFDYSLVLVGEEGKGKSFILKKLGKEWFSDSLTTVQGKEAYEQVQGVWFMELAELASIRKADVHAVKNFISKQEDRYRVAYGRRTENFPRQTVFPGTANDRNFLKAADGNRRFWPVDIMVHMPVKSVFDITDYEIDQLWSEAVYRYKDGESIFLDAQLESLAKAVQTGHTEEDDRVGLIEQYLDTLLPVNWDSLTLYERRAWLTHEDEIQAEGTVVRDRVCVMEIWCEALNGNQKDISKMNTKDLHSVMRHLKNWEEIDGKLRFGKYGTQRGYMRINVNGNTNLGVAVKNNLRQQRQHLS